MKTINTLMLYFIITVSVVSCASNERRNTLRDLDTINHNKKQTTVYIKPKTTEEIKSAYLEYLKHAKTNNRARMTAISRLAEIEFDLSDKILEEKKQKNISADVEDHVYNARLDKTIELLSTSLRDYPDEKTNDKIMYQLSKAYEQRGFYEKSIQTLKALTHKYPKSKYYIEAQFRIGEAAFSKRDYISAEDAYTEVISSRKNEVYFEKSTFKRAWARFKQNYYIEAVDDILSALIFHDFRPYDSLDKSEKSLFDEYYRTIGLSFAYAGGIKPLKKYIKSNNTERYRYRIYLSVSNVYKQQERFSDAVAVLKEYIRLEKNSKETPYAYLEIMDIWSQGGFAEKLNQAVRDFYAAYNPDSKYWKRKNRKLAHIQTSVTKSLKKYILQMATHYHKLFQKSRKNIDFKNSKLWYSRFLKHYKGFLHKDNVNFLYAELLFSAKHYKTALSYYERAAYDNELILDKNAAFATIITTDKLVANNKHYLARHLEYAKRYAQLYANDKQTGSILTHAAELAFKNKQYKNAIELIALLPASNSNSLTRAKTIAAQSYFKLAQYSMAEQAYLELLPSVAKTGKNYKNLINNIALAIYKQGESEARNNKPLSATEHYKRISDIVPSSKFAPTGLYDAIAIFMKNKQWPEAINAIEKFKKLYPQHKYIGKVTQNLSVAYLNSNQNLKAAREFERLSSVNADTEVKKTALLQAAKLYEEKQNFRSAIRSYSTYVKSHKKPYAQYIESLNKLFRLNIKIDQHKTAVLWRNKILKEDKRVNNRLKTDRTRFIVSKAFISKARENEQLYNKYQLKRPLKLNLKRKKQAMQSAVQLYGQASSYKISETSSEATYAIASIYYNFSKALLNSELPKGLNKNEQEQYKILLEDKAFPFEEKAIEFYEHNMEHTRDNIFNDWVKRSYAELKQLYPARYKRNFKLDEYINVVH